jgi:hypothetical protein
MANEVLADTVGDTGPVGLVVLLEAVTTVAVEIVVPGLIVVTVVTPRTFGAGEVSIGIVVVVPVGSSVGARMTVGIAVLFSAGLRAL